MKTWNIGVVGAGLIADFQARAVNDIPNAKLIGFCDKVHVHAKKLAEKYNCRAFEDYLQMAQSDDIDILVIATPSGFHMEPTIAGAQNGKHVLCEKPLEVSLERIDEMIAAHEKAGTKLGGIFPYRFNETLGVLKKAIEFFARSEGIMLDPVYTGRAAAGLLGLLSSGFFNKDTNEEINILFWHTGGTPALLSRDYEAIW